MTFEFGVNTSSGDSDITVEQMFQYWSNRELIERHAVHGQCHGDLLGKARTLHLESRLDILIPPSDCREMLPAYDKPQVYC